VVALAYLKYWTMADVGDDDKHIRLTDQRPML